MDKHLVMGGAKGNTENEVNAKVEIIEKVFKKHKGGSPTGPQVEDWKQALLTGRRHREMGEFGYTWVLYIL